MTADVEFEPGRWWRVTYSGGLWCETSNEREAREALATCPTPGTLQRSYIRTEYTWRTVTVSSPEYLDVEVGPAGDES